MNSESEISLQTGNRGDYFLEYFTWNIRVTFEPTSRWIGIVKFIELIINVSIVGDRAVVCGASCCLAVSIWQASNVADSTGRTNPLYTYRHRQTRMHYRACVLEVRLITTKE